MFQSQIQVGLYGTIGRIRIVKEKLITLLRDEEAIAIVEYAVAAGLITVSVAAALTALGISVSTIITTLTAVLTP